jgi:hypothetical protein
MPVPGKYEEKKVMSSYAALTLHFTGIPETYHEHLHSEENTNYQRKWVTRLRKGKLVSSALCWVRGTGRLLMSTEDFSPFKPCLGSQDSFLK